MAVQPTTNVTPRTILLKGRGIRDERVAQAAILPGQLLLLRSDGQFQVHNGAGAFAPATFALENELFGLGVDDTYNANDLVQAEMCGPPQWVLARLPASASAVNIGDLLQSNGDGNLTKVSGTNTPIAQALDAVNNSAGATTAFIRVRIV